MIRLRPKPTAIALAWTILVFVALMLPGSSVPQSGMLEYDKAIHALLFGVGVFLWMRVPWRSPAARWIIVLSALAFAPASEALQAVMGSGRAADPGDVVADLIGVALGAATWLFVRRIGPSSGDDDARSSERNDPAPRTKSNYQTHRLS